MDCVEIVIILTFLLIIFIIFKTGMLSTYIGEHFRCPKINISKFSTTCNYNNIISNPKKKITIVECN
jgi:hypothetical protein